MDGLALQTDHVPVAWQAMARQRLFVRERTPELRFSFYERAPQLPVLSEGEFRFVAWGNKNGVARLPKGGWCEIEEFEAGRWQWLEPREIIIPCNFGRQSGRWFLIEAGVRGVLVHDEHGHPHAYLLTEPASHYYEIMCRSKRMPVLIDQRI